jgi:hypothetical protein
VVNIGIRVHTDGLINFISNRLRNILHSECVCVGCDSGCDGGRVSEGRVCEYFDGKDEGGQLNLFSEEMEKQDEGR